MGWRKWWKPQVQMKIFVVTGTKEADADETFHCRFFHLHCLCAGETKKKSHKFPLVKVTCDPLDCFLHVFVPLRFMGPNTMSSEQKRSRKMDMATSSSFRSSSPPRLLIHAASSEISILLAYTQIKHNS